MRDAGRRPMGRLCYWALVLVFAVVGGSARATAQSGPATTTVSDTVYLAGGGPAQGVLIITWPAFVTAGGAQIAASSTNVTLGSGGALSVALVPNAGATPAGVYYTVVYQLGPGEVKTEYWLVPASTTPVNLAAVVTTPGSGVAAQPVSMQYVNSALAAKANDNAVVHLANAETITGVKTFNATPNVPAPVNPGDVANKSYVDTSVSNVGSGVYLPTAGGTMTGPITLPANPAAPMQASTKQYVDTGLAAKANLISGVVPASQLGTGSATTGSCLLGNGASANWGTCGGGSGTGNVSTTPAASQTIAQPEGTQFSTNNLANIRYVTSSWNWAQTPADSLATAGSNTIHLSPCPLGLDTASSANYYSYKVYIAGTGTPEAAPVTGGNCVPGTASGTITVTTAYVHASGYTVGSASTGIQEAWNDAWVNDSGGGPNASSLTAPYVKLMSNAQYSIYGSVYLRGRGGVLDGAGAFIACSTRDRCIYVGTTAGFPSVTYHHLYNLSGTSTVAVDGAQVASVSATAGTYTITTVSAHPFQAGDMVDCEYHSQTADQHWVNQVLAAGLTATTFEVSFGANTLAAGTNTFGFCNIENAFIEDNSDHVIIADLSLMQANPAGQGYFTYGVINDNDQHLQIERATNRGSSIINPNGTHFTPTWPLGAFAYQRTDQGNAGIIYLHNSEFTNINCASAGGNGFVVDDTVCQGFPMYGFRYFGGLQPATFSNVYQETAPALYNPLYSGSYPAQMGYLVQAAQPVRVVGTWPTQSQTPMYVNNGSTSVSYFVVPRSSNFGYGPVLFAGSALSSGTGNITVQWPSVELLNNVGQNAGTLTWDVIKTTGVNTAAPNPSAGGILVAQNISGSCTTGGICSTVDAQTSTTAYSVQAQTFTPVFWWWPVNYAINNDVLQIDRISTQEPLVATQGLTGVAVVAQWCDATGYGITQQRSPAEVTCLGSSTISAGAIATVLRQQDAGNNGPAANAKGRLNFGKAIAPPNDIVTLVDSNLAKTESTFGERPPNDAGDVAIGVDQTGGLSQRAPNSISEYVNVTPNGTNYAERLTASGKTFNVPVTVNGNVTATGTVSTGMTGGPFCVHETNGVLSATSADCGSGGGSLSTVQGEDVAGGASGPVSIVAPLRCASFNGTDVFAGCAAAMAVLPSTTPQGGTLDGEGYSGQLVESAATLASLNTNWTKGERVKLGGYQIWLPLAPSAAGNVTSGTQTPPAGVIVLSKNSQTMEGLGAGQNGGGTLFEVCPGTHAENSSIPSGCVDYVTRQWPVAGWSIGVSSNQTAYVTAQLGLPTFPIASESASGGVVTFTLGATCGTNGATQCNPTGMISVGMPVTVSGTTNYNGSYTAASVTATGFTVASSTTGASSAGTVTFSHNLVHGEYFRWVNTTNAGCGAGSASCNGVDGKWRVASPNSDNGSFVDTKATAPAYSSTAAAGNTITFPAPSLQVISAVANGSTIVITTAENPAGLLSASLPSVFTLTGTTAGTGSSVNGTYTVTSLTSTTITANATVTGTATGNTGVVTTILAPPSSCGTTCGTVVGRIPVVQVTGATGNKVEKVGIELNGVPSAVGYECFGCQEQSELSDVTITDTVEECGLAWTTASSNQNALHNDQCLAGAGISTYNALTSARLGGSTYFGVGTTGWIAAENGWRDFGEGNISTVMIGGSSGITHPYGAGLIADTSGGANVYSDFHCENCQFGVLAGTNKPFNGASVWSIGTIPASDCQQNCVPTDGAYQGVSPATIYVSSNFNAAYSSMQYTSGYVFNDILGGGASAHTFVDLNTGCISTDSQIGSYVWDTLGGVLKNFSTSTPDTGCLPNSPVGSGVAYQIAMYPAAGTQVSGDSALTDTGTTLNYTGSGGISAAAGNFSGNLTVNGQLLVAGPWMVSSPIPGTAMGAASAGTSSLGISNDGNLYVSNSLVGGPPQKVATTTTSSYFANLFQEGDQYDVGQYVVGETAANPQNLHVYSSYTNATTWTRESVGFDTADNYAVLRSESLPAGSAYGLGFWVNNGLKWVIDPASASLKPWADDSYTIGTFSGTSGLRPSTVYAAGASSSFSGFELGQFANNSYELCNDGTTGTVLNGLAVLTTAGCAVEPTSNITSGAIGVVIANAGKSGTVTLVRTGTAYCSFDSPATTVGDYVVASSVNGSAFACHDAGSTLPSGQQVLGRVLQAEPANHVAQMFFDMPGSTAGVSAVSSVFTRTGAVTAQSGDYSFAQISGNLATSQLPTGLTWPSSGTVATTASPTFTGTVTEPDGTTNTSSGYTFAHALTLPNGSVATTQTAGDNSTKVATTAYVRSEQYMTYSCPLGSVGTVEQFCTWTLPAGITVTGFDLSAGTDPVGCTTSAVVQVWDGTANVEVGSFSIALSNGNNFYTQVTGSTNVASGHALRVKTTTGEAGCSTTAANVVAVVTYQMAN